MSPPNHTEIGISLGVTAAHASYVNNWGTLTLCGDRHDRDSLATPPLVR